MELEPYQEDAHQQLMRLLALSGRRGDALAQFEALKQVLAGELDVESAAESVALYESIRVGELEGTDQGVGRDGHTGEEILAVSDSSPITAVALSPDGRYLAAAGLDGTISVYITSVEELMEVARARLSQGFTRGECQTYLSLEECPQEP